MYTCPLPRVNRTLTNEALDYRRTIMAYDYMDHRGNDFADIPGAWNRMLRLKPDLRPFGFLFQRGGGKQPKVSECYVIGPGVYTRAIGQRLLDLVEDRHPTLKPHYFDKAVKGHNPREDVVGWFDLRNSFCWFTDEAMWRNAGRFLGVDTDFPFRFAEPKWETTFVVTKPVTNEISAPLPLSLAPDTGLCVAAAGCQSQDPVPST